jgi:hypothetical protein
LQSLFEGTASRKSNELAQSAARLLRRVSELGLAISVAPNSKIARVSDVALLAQVDDAPAVVEQTVELFKQAGKQSKDGKETFHVEQARVAGKPSRLITAAGEEKDGPRDKKEDAVADLQALLLTELDAKTVLACLLPGADAAEATVTKFASRPAKSLGGNAALKKTAALLPERPQVALYFDAGSAALLGFFGVSPAGGSDVPPLGFTLAAFQQGIEAQFVIPYETLQAVVEGARKREEK